MFCKVGVVFPNQIGGVHIAGCLKPGYAVVKIENLSVDDIPEW